MERNETQGGAVFLDDEHFPFLVVSWVGVGVVDHAKAYVEWAARMADRADPDTTLMIINDATRAGRPGPEFRKFFSDFLGTPHGQALLTTDNLTLVVLDNPLVRGALTAVGWMAPAVRKMRVTSSLKAAFVAASEESARRGQEIDPPNLEGYQHPADRDQPRPHAE